MKKFISKLNSKTVLGVSLFAVAATLSMSGCNDSPQSCSVAQSGNTEVITCPDGSSATIPNGQSGGTADPAVGPAAPTSPLTWVQLIAPCGDASSQYKEVLMLFSDGSLLADFSGSTSADAVRLVLIPGGTYQDTDDSACEFQVATSGSTRQMTWGAGTSSDDPSGWAAGGWSWTTPVAAAGATPLNSNL